MKQIIALLAIYICSHASVLDFTTLQSDFTQTLNSNDKKANYSGKFYIKNNNEALWIYKKPNPKKIYFTNSKIIMIEDELEQAIISNFNENINLSEILLNAKKITDSLYEADFQDTKYKITIKENLPFNISYEDKLGNKIDITLSNVVKDKEISQDILTPKIPNGYDIITQ
ncbi:hypothetical protein BFG05_01895 [Campylobacter pinnipediorum subsp. pinnipediorum]|uniref:LolA-like outer membrane lipoprotein chaperone n=1 Tax=Campylobacter pinnipediorum TaxID=1965231 RepID=UPI000994DE30|nr:LolA-like outer membrane lipoprotein chaperone [Campylobacter pinnipediorum]OPA79875.1 hypothetical protein BFG05_01895 [Campylobacter pinnipediorum subsp. pinnipediorum]